MIDIVVTLVIVLALAFPLGKYMAQIFSGVPVFPKKILCRVERSFYRLAGINPKEEMSWKCYLKSLLLFSLGGLVLLFGLLMAQTWLPLNPAKMPALTWDLAFNIAASFITNTNWQSYAGEAVLSHYSQMVGLTVQNFLSAAVGIAVALALFRAFARKEAETIGNFWVDVTRAILYVLLPLSLVFALALVSQGVIDNFSAPVTATTLQGAEQVIAQGPVASQEAIKMLGTNGGGFFNANSAHPYENPNSITNILQLIAILLLPAALVVTFGYMVRDIKQGVSILVAMTVLLLLPLALVVSQERLANPLLAPLGVEQSAGNMEGKEVRFGTDTSAFWALTTTATSSGSVNAMHSSFMPLGGLVPMVMMQLGEVVFGGVGSGIMGMLIFVLLTVFVAGLMVGRTPEYLGKKISAFEMKMVSIIVILPGALILAGVAVFLSTDAGVAGLMHKGPHGFSEVLYALSSAANNNGSAFAGLSANSPFYNLLLGVVMLIGRFGVIAAALAMAGTIAAKNIAPTSAGTLPTHTPLFVTMLIFVVLLVGLLTFTPALALGPIVEHLQLFGAKL